MKYIGGFLAVFALIALLFGTLLQCLFVAAYDMDFYARVYGELGRPAATGMSEEDLLRVTGVVTAYLQGAREEIVVSAPVHGQERVIFNEKETLHMQDVRKLYDIARTVRTACFVGGGLLLLFALWLGKKGRSTIFAGAVLGCVAFFVIGGILVFQISTNFTGMFTQFHELLFTNDLWLLDPAKDILIQMFPTEFFMEIALRIGKQFATAAIFIICISLACWRVLKERAKHAA